MTVDSILVTGAPRSGTTWLARLLALAPGTSLPGREPMNPRGRGYGLAGTLSRWTCLTEPTPRQARALRQAYKGRNPWTFSRYGRRQWAAPMTHTCVIVKDPFAVMSVAAVARVTAATTVLLYRHPAAVLASYRKMGWTADLEELRSIANSRLGVELPRDAEAADAEAFGAFWGVLYSIALSDVDDADVVVVSHEEVAVGGPGALTRLFEALDLRVGSRVEAEFEPQEGSTPSGPAPAGRLHDFDRDPKVVAEQWRERISAVDVADAERGAGPTHSRLESARLQLLS